MIIHTARVFFFSEKTKDVSLHHFASLDGEKYYEVNKDPHLTDPYELETLLLESTARNVLGMHRTFLRDMDAHFTERVID